MTRYWATLPDRRICTHRSRLRITHLAAIQTHHGWIAYRWATSPTAARHALDRGGVDVGLCGTGAVLPATTTDPRP